MRRPCRDRRILVGVLLTVLASACGTTVPLTQQQASGLAPGQTGGAALSNNGALVDPAQGPSTARDATSAPAPKGELPVTSGSQAPSTSDGTAAGQGPAAEPTGALAVASIPSTGPGWDAKQIYVGFPTENDLTKTAATLGYEGVQLGDFEGNVKAVLAGINAKGGLFGRRVVPAFHDNSTSDLLTNPNAAAQSNCTYFNQDRRVVAVVNLLTLLDIDNFRSCMAKAKIPVFAAGQITDDVVLKQLGGLYLNLAASYTSYTPAFIDRLKAQGFFSGWDFTQGKPNTTKPKVGLLIYTAGATEKRVGQIFATALKNAGYPAVTTYEYTDVLGSQMSNAVLKFRSSGVTHVFDYTAAITQFMSTAEQQNYRPRYALVSSMGPRDVIAGHVPDAQLVGSMGAGFCPVCEVPGANDPKDSPGAPSCEADLAKGGLRYSGESQRSALGIAYATCDGLKLVASAFKAGRGLTSTNLVAGLDQVGRNFPTARSFRSGLSRSRPSLPSVIRDFSWNPPCTCFLYGRGTRTLN